MAELTIGALARSAGVGVETVRYYQRSGLMPEPPRPPGPGSAGGVRRYGPEAARRLRFIRSAQAAGFRLDEIRELLALDATRERHRARDLAQRRIAALDAKIAELTAARTALSRLAAACASGGDGPCPILAAFEDSPGACGRNPI
ncbi:MerR family DNA-binding protein [Phenylobacterium sp.]|uniref:MerR family DNA-binding protein n=1 Tax=Phenylobacterium sp. TaxID=1871053 RepID=UPI0025D70B1E|nr:MerR family DNA-binding protein [Phenylobacterium sp.]MBX3482285.1 MerR family DNA-binding protein [Phenylobacterium sp.]MCW5760747.1 MerR family DNA-binding protein [Phenylobacterium sp.]